LKNESVSFFFETFVNSELRYETFVDFHRNEWCTYPAGVDSTVLMRGQFASPVAGNLVLDGIKRNIKAAIESGHI
jgi:hypothetical protein